MSALGEKTLFGLLTDADALDVLAREGLDIEVVPTEALRPVVVFALRHYRETGKAPSEAMLGVEFGDLLSDHEMAVGTEPDESIEWAVDDLKATYVRQQAGLFAKSLITEITEAASEDRVEVLSGKAAELSALVLRMVPRTTVVDMRESGVSMLDSYDARAVNRGQITGLRFGLPQIDAYTGGIHDGELAVLGAPPKTGKSYFLNFTAKSEWEAERVTVLFTMENSIAMTEGRIACLALHLDARAWSRGTLPEDEVERVRQWVNDVLHKSECPLYIVSPTKKNRTVEAMVAVARAYDADSIVVDQLNFIQPSPDAGRGQAKTYEYGDILEDLKMAISTGRNPIPCLLAHQINREGQKAAEREGRLHMSHYADSASVERTADWAFGLYQSADERATRRAQFQTLAARREDVKHWDMVWQIEHGHVLVRNEIELN